MRRTALLGLAVLIVAGCGSSRPARLPPVRDGPANVVPLAPRRAAAVPRPPAERRRDRTRGPALAARPRARREPRRGPARPHALLDAAPRRAAQPPAAGPLLVVARGGLPHLDAALPPREGHRRRAEARGRHARGAVRLALRRREADRGARRRAADRPRPAVAAFPVRADRG